MSDKGDQPTPEPDFDAQYGRHNTPVFRALVAEALAEGHDPVERAHDYAERGKPEFVLAYLLVADLPAAEKREFYASSFERRARNSEQRAAEMDRRFHRPFPLIKLEASKDRLTAQRIRAGGALRPGMGRPLPTL